MVKQNIFRVYYVMSIDFILSELFITLCFSVFRVSSSNLWEIFRHHVTLDISQTKIV